MKVNVNVVFLATQMIESAPLKTSESVFYLRSDLDPKERTGFKEVSYVFQTIIL